ncbi:hypothetical protein [Thermotalea metallivorans]|uniref:Uncharacterized protein n=1 Tax=Thermotalea metallivorans TaxID=520762 RepID=A0A140LCI1_9FIRM|nr:hypothetical protein [Thermotalea metallivorans]KXG78256.1 hypothetical protein AN619_02310 [Thermotalea metallivorans]
MTTNERLEVWRRVINLSDAQRDRLEEIVLEHTRLVKEHVQPSTTQERKKEIRQKILQLEFERKMLIGR